MDSPSETARWLLEKRREQGLDEHVHDAAAARAIAQALTRKARLTEQAS